MYWDEVDPPSKAQFDHMVCKRPIFMNVNDRFSQNATEYKQQIGWYHAAMDTIFPEDGSEAVQDMLAAGSVWTAKQRKWFNEFESVRKVEPMPGQQALVIVSESTACLPWQQARCNACCTGN